MRKFGLLVSFWMFAASSAFAEDCSRIDVRDKMSPELQEHFRTPLEQGPLGWCYAYTASDMMTQAVGTPVSSTYTGSYYNTQMSSPMRWVRSLFQEADVPEGGFTHIAVDEMQHSGMLCKASVLTSQGVLKIQTLDGPGTGKLSLLFTFLEQYRKGKCTGPCESYIDGLITAYLPGFEVAQVKKYIHETAGEKLDHATFKLFNEICSKDPIPVRKDQFKLKIVDKSSGTARPLPGYDRPSFTRQLDDALLAGKVVGVEYDASYVDPKLTYVYRWHASSVIGREQVGQACYYRVRNTWGKNFTNYAPGILFGDAPDGSYLVDRNTFRNMAIRLIWIE